VMPRPRGYALALIVVVAVSVVMGAVTAAIGAGELFPDGSKGCQSNIERCPSFVDWHTGLAEGARVTVVLLVIGLLAVAVVWYLMKPPHTPPS
jgi:hypothetical protein